MIKISYFDIAKFFLSIICSIILLKNTGAQSLKGITSKPDTSYTTYSAYISSKKTNPETRMLHQLNFHSITEKRNIEYCNIGGRKLHIDVFYKNKKQPTKKIAIIIIHGGGWRSGNRTQHYPLAQKLASLGYVCFTPEYRLSTEALFPASIYDIKSAIRWVRKNAKEYSIDTGRITILGFSAGGEIAAFMGATGNMPLFEGTNCNTGISTSANAIVDIDGTLSFVHPDSHEGDDSKGTSAANYWFGYPKKENPVLWEAASPLSYVSAKTPPTLFINSSVPWMHAGREDYIKILKENHIYSEVHNFKNAPHSFCLFDPWFNPTVEFIDNFLKKIFNQ